MVINRRGVSAVLILVPVLILPTHCGFFALSPRLRCDVTSVLGRRSWPRDEMASS